MFSVASALSCAGIGLADDHAVLLLHRRVGGGRLHAAEFERRPLVLVEIGEDRRGRDRLGREAQRRAGAHRAGRLGDRRAVLGHQQAGDAVIGARPRDIVLRRPRRRSSRPARIASCSSSIVASSSWNGLSSDIGVLPGCCALPQRFRGWRTRWQRRKRHFRRSRSARQCQAVWRRRAARARSTETSCETPRSAIVTPNSRSTRAIVMR